jgi:hypothetical protein
VGEVTDIVFLCDGPFTDNWNPAAGMMVTIQFPGGGPAMRTRILEVRADATIVLEPSNTIAAVEVLPWV